MRQMLKEGLVKAEILNALPDLQETGTAVEIGIEKIVEVPVEVIKEVEVEKIVEELADQEIEVSVKEEIIAEPTLKVVEEILVQPFDELEQTLFSAEETVAENPVKNKKEITLEEELDDTISVEVAADLFEKPEIKKSLNDQLQQNIQIGLNDRIAFVKNLFDGNQEDFNRVVSQLNTTKSFKEAKKFVNKMVKPDYNWANQEEYEERFFAIIERKFA